MMDAGRKEIDQEEHGDDGEDEDDDEDDDEEVHHERPNSLKMAFRELKFENKTPISEVQRKGKEPVEAEIKKVLCQYQLDLDEGKESGNR
ncbi:hypothetical protein WAI453_001652 [Rhynchosporium graminicola]